MTDVHNLALLEKKLNKTNKTLIAVSKTFGIDKVLWAYNLGFYNFGENYLQEAQGKIQKAKDLALKNITWHFIGKTQTKKIKDLYKNFDIIHSLESEKHILKFKEIENIENSKKKFLIQIKLVEDINKGGMSVKEFKKLIPLFKNSPEFIGLMYIPPAKVNDTKLRELFVNINALRNDTELDLNKKLELSMGMSSDYQLALECNSSMIRVGSKIFGPRS